MATINLTRGEFLKRVADIENSPNQWKYLGSRRALVDVYAPWGGLCKALLQILDFLRPVWAQCRRHSSARSLTE